MPEISRFLGIVIGMFYNDHSPPHFHASYGEHEVAIGIRDGAILWGGLPRRALGHVQEWRQRARGRFGGELGACSEEAAADSHSAIGVIMPRLVEARYVRDYVLWLRFSDGSGGEVDLAGELDGPVFEPLRDSLYFRSFVLHPELHTVVWPNGADLAPEFLYERIRVPA